MDSKILVLMATICLLGLGDGEPSKLSLSYSRSEIVLNPGSRENLTVVAALFGDQYTSVEFQISLRGAKNIYLSLKSDSNVSTSGDQDKCSNNSCNLTATRKPARIIIINLKYNSTLSGVISSDKSYTIDVQTTPPDILPILPQFKLIARDGRSK